MFWREYVVRFRLFAALTSTQSAHNIVITPRESDWKTYSRMVPDLRDSYLERINEEIIAILSDSRKTPADRFWAARKRSNKTAKILQDCLDPHSRSKMFIHILVMLKHGMITEEALSAFSDELQAQVAMFLEI